MLNLQLSLKSTVAAFVYGDLSWDELHEHLCVCAIIHEHPELIGVDEVKTEPFYDACRKVWLSFPTGVEMESNWFHAELRRRLRPLVPGAPEVTVGFHFTTGTDTLVTFSEPIRIG